MTVYLVKYTDFILLVSVLTVALQILFIKHKNHTQNLGTICPLTYHFSSDFKYSYDCYQLLLIDFLSKKVLGKIKIPFQVFFFFFLPRTGSCLVLSSREILKFVSKVFQLRCHGQSYTLCTYAPTCTVYMCIYNMLKDTLSDFGYVNGKIKNDVTTGLLPRNMSQI